MVFAGIASIPWDVRGGAHSLSHWSLCHLSFADESLMCRVSRTPQCSAHWISPHFQFNLTFPAFEVPQASILPVRSWPRLLIGFCVRLCWPTARLPETHGCDDCYHCNPHGEWQRTQRLGGTSRYLRLQAFSCSGPQNHLNSLLFGGLPFWFPLKGLLHTPPGFHASHRSISLAPPELCTNHINTSSKFKVHDSRENTLLLGPCLCASFLLLKH